MLKTTGMSSIYFASKARKYKRCACTPLASCSNSKEVGDFFTNCSANTKIVAVSVYHDDGHPHDWPHCGTATDGQAHGFSHWGTSTDGHVHGSLHWGTSTDGHVHGSLHGGTSTDGHAHGFTHCEPCLLSPTVTNFNAYGLGQLPNPISSAVYLL
uniref:Pfam-B_12657 and Pfam-B_9564 domain containing protein n=1 Tax=Echinococcus granulosus TaxID=6210 RepID=A0A068X3F0_ECHGR|nr:Pfam-B_12657 and Pfam-B_9564 domain containing protein [Echinococcus granulosus]